MKQIRKYFNNKKHKAENLKPAVMKVKCDKIRDEIIKWMK